MLQFYHDYVRFFNMTQNKKGKKMTVYALAERKKLCEDAIKAMPSCGSAYKACEKVGVAYSNFMRWVAADGELLDSYARARQDLLEGIAQQIVDITDAQVERAPDGRYDPTALQKQRLQVDTRKWLLSKLLPKQYGDRLALAGDAENPIVVEAIDARKLSNAALAEILDAQKTETVHVAEQSW